MRRLIAGLLLLALCSPSFAQEITFTAETTSGNGQVTPDLTWSTSPTADSCVASGGWSGEKGASGSETLPAIMSSATYNLECTWQDSTVLLRWTAPTENTDGTPLTDLAGYNVYYGAASGEYTTTEPLNDAGAQSYLVGPLDPGTYFFAVTALNARGVESDFSGEVQHTLGPDVVTESVGITVNPKPAAPTGLTAE